jgi:hypothetical protein
MLTNCCGQVVSLILGNDGGIPPLSLCKKWTSCDGEVMRDWNTGDFCGFCFCGIYGYIKSVDVVMSHEGNVVSLSFCNF